MIASSIEISPQATNLARSVEIVKFPELNILDCLWISFKSPSVGFKSRNLYTKSPLIRAILVAACR